VGTNRFEATEWRHSNSLGRKPRVTTPTNTLRSPGGAALRISRVVVTLLVFCSLTAFSAPAQAAGPKVHIVIAAEADPLEKFAAEEMAGQLKKLFDAETTITTALPADAEHVILLGHPATHAAMKDLKQALPKLSDQGHALKSLKIGERTILVVTGGTSRSILWAAYELGWHFGVRYFLFGDLLPATTREFTLSGFDKVLEPVVRARRWNPWNGSPVGAGMWGKDEHISVLRQLAKLKFTHVLGDQAESEAQDSPQGPQSLRIGVSGDTLGRSAFKGAKFFELPELAGAATEVDRAKASQSLRSAILDEARRLGFIISRTKADGASSGDFVFVGGGFTMVPAAPPRLLSHFVDLLIAKPQVYLWIDAGVRDDMAVSIAVFGRRAVDPSQSFEAVFTDLIDPICGEGVAPRVLLAIDHCAKADSFFLDEGSPSDFAKPEERMFLRHYESDEPPPAWWAEVRTNYLNAMNEMYRANTRAREGGRQFTLWYARRFEFGYEYMNVVEALRKAGIAKREGNKDEQIAELEKALDSLTGACNAMAAVARSQSDRGIIAVMNEYGYRPVTKLLEEADASN